MSQTKYNISYNGTYFILILNNFKYLIIIYFNTYFFFEVFTFLYDNIKFYFYISQQSIILSILMCKNQTSDELGARNRVALRDIPLQNAGLLYSTRLNFKNLYVYVTYKL